MAGKKGKGADGGKDLTRIDLRARAVEYALRDPEVPECWRAATLKDLADDKFDVSLVKPAELPESWKPRDAKGGWTIDELNLLARRVKNGDATVEKPERKPSSSPRRRRNEPERKVRLPMVKSPCSVRQTMYA